MDKTPWPRSKRAVIGAGIVVGNSESRVSESDIQAIANMMDSPPPTSPKPTSESGIPIPAPHINSFQFDVSPEAAAQVMIQNYVKKNGSIILD